MNRNVTIDEQIANEIYDLLVDHAGASTKDNRRAQFIHFLTNDAASIHDTLEFRFMGALGFGGKFWIGRESFLDESDPNWHGEWWVNQYREDETPETVSMVKATQSSLNALYLSKRGETR